MAESVMVNFSDPLPVFPLGETVLLPHALLPLHIFEPRYRQMVRDCMARNRLFVIATIDQAPGRPCRVREAACVAHIIEHQGMPDGRANILVGGVCRVCIASCVEPTDGRLYHMVRVRPIESPDDPPSVPPELRASLRAALDLPRLASLHPLRLLHGHAIEDDIPTAALVDMVASVVLHGDELRYAFLAEADASRRAGIVTRELRSIDALIEHAERINAREWPPGVSWN